MARGSFSFGSTVFRLAALLAMTMGAGCGEDPNAGPSGVLTENGLEPANGDVTSPASLKVPVLLFHGVCPGECKDGDPYAISQLRFHEMMAAIDALGFHTILSEEYSYFLLREPNHLPRKPILITFDDGRADAYQNADPILERHGMRAVSFLITACITSKRGYYMSWDDVSAATASGRWDFQLHAHAGHVNAPVSAPHADGTSAEGHAYAWRTWLSHEGRNETRDEWLTRVRTDLDVGTSLLALRVPGFVPRLFAVPYGDYGEYETNDGEIKSVMRYELDHRFIAWFTQEKKDPDFSVPFKRAEQHRFEVNSSVTTDMLTIWLESHDG